MMYDGNEHTKSVMSMNAPPDDLTVAERWDRALRAMSYEPRRRLILALIDEEPTTSVGLPDAADSTYVGLSKRELSVTLQHHHLPALEEIDYIHWRLSPFEAGRGPNFDEAAAVIRMILSFAEHLPTKLVQGCEPLEKRIS